MLRKISVTLPLIALLLAGCDETSLTPADRGSVCTALKGPIYYNTYDSKSGRYSGPVLALDLKSRNQIGQRLGCPAFKLHGGQAAPAPHVSGYGGSE